MTAGVTTTPFLCSSASDRTTIRTTFFTKKEGSEFLVKICHRVHELISRNVSFEKLSEQLSSRFNFSCLFSQSTWWKCLFLWGIVSPSTSFYFFCFSCRAILRLVSHVFPLIPATSQEKLCAPLFTSLLTKVDPTVKILSSPTTKAGL